MSGGTRWALVCAAGLAVGLIGGVPSVSGGPTRDGHPLNRPEMGGPTPGSGPRQPGLLRGPRGVGAPGPVFLPNRFRGVPARIPHPGTRPPAQRSPGFLVLIDRTPMPPKGVEGPFLTEAERVLEAACLEALRRPVLVYTGGVGFYPGGVVVYPGWSAREALYGYRFDGVGSIEGRSGMRVSAPNPMVVGVDPRLWPWWTSQMTLAGSALSVQTAGVMEAEGVEADATPLSEEALLALGLYPLPAAGVVRGSGLFRDSGGLSSEDWSPALSEGLSALADGDALGAVEALRARVEDRPEEAGSRRLLAVALLESGDASSSARVMDEAYRMDPGLGLRAMGDGLLPPARGRSDRFVRLLEHAVRAAHREGTREAWLLAAVMAQSAGRVEVATRLAARAVAAGLDPVVGAGFGVGSE